MSVKNVRYQPFKNEKTNDFLRSVTFIIVGLLISMLLVTVFSIVVTNISATMTYDTTMAIKKNNLNENVNNMIIFIDEERGSYLTEHPDATNEEVEEHVKELVRTRIYEEQHFDGAYM